MGIQMLRNNRGLSTLALGMILLCGLAGASEAQSGETGNVCVRDFTPGAVCTANDVRIEELTPQMVIEDCGSGVVGETEVVFEILVSADGSPDRFDIGLYLALDGGSARDGDSCFHDFLDPPLSTTPTLGDANMDGIPDISGGPWLDGDSDSCGDIGTNTQVIKLLQTLRFACVDNNLDGSVDVAVCTSWDNNSNTTCNDLSGAFPGTNSKCSCDSVELGIAPEVPVPGISVSKDPATQAVAPGGSAVFTITVDNTGETDLTSIVVDDPQCTSLVGPTGDTDMDTELDIDETWTYTCTVTNVTAAFTNSVTVTGTPPTGPDVSDSDTADVTLTAPSITVSKDPPTQTVLSGSNVMFTITVDNSGDTNIDSVTVDDPQCDSLVGPTGDTDMDTELDVDETWTYTCTVNNVTADFTNTVTVTGVIIDAPSVEDSDTADVTVENPSLAVTKDPPNQVVVSGSSAVFTITAENTGDVDLTSIMIDDPQCTSLIGPTGDTDDDGELDVGETWSYTCTVANVTAGFTNTVTVTGTPPTGPDVSDGDTADVTVENPSLAVTKDPPNQAVAPGDSAVFTITVENTGDVDLTSIVVDDPQCTSLVGPTGDTDMDNELDVGETWSYTCTVTNVMAGFTNTVTVTGTPPTGPDVSDGDTADVSVVTPEDPLVTALKTSALLTDNDGSGTLSPGDVLQYTIVIENNGGADALDVVFTDTPDANTALVAGSVTTTQGVVTTGNGGGDVDVAVDIGTIAPAGQVTVTFEVLLADPFPMGVTQISNQGIVSGSNFPDVPTDDPGTIPGGDPTVDGIPNLAPIPTLSEWGLLLLTLLLGLYALRRIRQSRGVA